MHLDFYFFRHALYVSSLNGGMFDTCNGFYVRAVSTLGFLKRYDSKRGDSGESKGWKEADERVTWQGQTTTHVR